MKSWIWFLVSFTGFLVLVRSFAIVAAMKPGESVTVWLMMQIGGPLVAWLIVLTAAYVVERLLDDEDQ